MSKKYPGGLVTSTPPLWSSGNTYGIWTMQQVMQRTNGGFWPGLRTYYIGYGSAVLGSAKFYAASTSSSFILGTVGISGISRSVIYKLDSSGNTLACRFISSNGGGNANALNVDGSGNIYVAEYDNTGPQTVKLNSSFTYQAAYQNNASSYFSAASIDPSGNTYGLFISGSSPYFFRVVKWDSSGVVTFSRDIANFFYPYANTIAYDSSGNTYIAGASTNFSTGYRGVLIKLSTTGTTTWYLEYSPTTAVTFLYGVAVNSSGDVYSVGSTTSDSGNYDAYVHKVNSSGSQQWKKRLTNGSTTTQYLSVALDSSGNVYAAGSTGGAGMVVKYDSSGNLQWQRSITASSGNASFNNIAIDSNNDLYLAGTLSAAPTGANTPLAMKVKSDGSGTGAYVFGSYTLTYAASSYTDTTSGVSSSSVSYSNSSISTTASSGSSSITAQNNTFFMKAVA